MYKRLVVLAVLSTSLPLLLGQQTSTGTVDSHGQESHQWLVHASCKDKPTVLDPATTQVLLGQEPIKEFSLSSANSLPLRYALLLDVSGSTRPASSFILQSASRLVKTLNGLRGEGVLGLFGEKAEFDDQIARPERVVPLVRQARIRGTSALYDALFSAVETLPRRFPADGKQRYALFVVTDAQDNASAASSALVISAAREHHVAIYPIILKVFEGRDTEKNQQDLAQVAILTGGVWFLLAHPEEFEKSVKQYLDSQQLLGFTTASASPISIRSAKCERLRVSLAKPALGQQ